MRLDQIQSDSGSIAPLVAGYLALIILTILGSAAVGVSMIAVNRVQAVADAAVLYAHDRSITRGIPNQTALLARSKEFLANAPSAKRISIESVSVRVSGAISELELCAVVQNPLFPARQSFCRVARAESFVIR
jgi:hypothetical protein